MYSDVLRLQVQLFPKDRKFQLNAILAVPNIKSHSDVSISADLNYITCTSNFVFLYINWYISVKILHYLNLAFLYEKLVHKQSNLKRPVAL